jgi:hypothetical protein
MIATRTAFQRMLKMLAISAFVVIIVGYAVWRSLNYARGPSILVTEPLNGSTVSTSVIDVKGQALRVNTITLNGRPISVDQQGNFSETVIVFPGLNVLTIEAGDQFNRHVKTELQIFGNSVPPSPTNK